MKTNIEVLEDNKAKLVITVEARDVDNAINATYKSFAQKYRFPGFRAGKAPRPVIDNAFGKHAVAAQVTEELVHKTFPLAVDENDLFTVGDPTIEPQDLLAQSGKDLEYVAIVELIPQFELSSYDPVEIKLPSEKVIDEEVEDQLARITEYYAEFKDASGATKVKKGNFVELSIKALNAEGEKVPRFDTDKALYEVGAGSLPAAFEEHIIGLKRGGEVSFEIDFAADEAQLVPGVTQDMGKVSFDVVVNLIKNKVLPELTDEWVKENLQIENLDLLKEDICTSLVEQKKQMIERMKESECLYALQERLQGEVPESLCEQEEANLLQNFFTQLQQQGATFDMYLAANGLTADQFKEDIKKQARDVATQDACLDAYARHAGIQVTDEEVTNEFKQFAGKDAQKLETEWRREGRIHFLRRTMKRTRAVYEIMEKAQVTEQDPKPKKKASKKAAEQE